MSCKGEFGLCMLLHTSEATVTGRVCNKPHLALFNIRAKLIELTLQKPYLSVEVSIMQPVLAICTCRSPSHIRELAVSSTSNGLRSPKMTLKVLKIYLAMCVPQLACHISKRWETRGPLLSALRWCLLQVSLQFTKGINMWHAIL